VSTEVLGVFFAALATALATGVGALPLLVIRSVGRAVVGAANAAAAGVMLAASVALFREGSHQSLERTAVGTAVGVAFIVLAGRFLHHDRELKLGVLRGADARKALLIVAVMLSTPRRKESAWARHSEAERRSGS
jgi:zinc transporter, ZIP family